MNKLISSKLFTSVFLSGLLCFIFFVTIKVSGYPAALLSHLFTIGEYKLRAFASCINLHPLLESAVIDGIYGMVSRVITVALPPMAIFFPVFTLLEECGLLRIVSRNTDTPLKKCGSCGGQCLSMLMGFGCNACGVTGCRIIDNEKKRLRAVITNGFIPCNGKFPTLVTLITLFFIDSEGSGSFKASLILLTVFAFSVMSSLLVTKLLSISILKDEEKDSSAESIERDNTYLSDENDFLLKKPDIYKVLITSVIERTLSVMSRAVFSAAPAGLFIWAISTFPVSGNGSMLYHLVTFLDPFARFLLLDGAILASFLLSLPANEIFLPILLMTYSLSGETGALLPVLTANGWNEITAMAVIIFAVFHFPCMTTLLTIKKETGSLKWTALGFFIPTITGLMTLFTFRLLASVLQVLP
ncbi:MAG: hypothetical protein IJF28_03280 [Firmicutes bacterium]|nr:hypothetical protein [Bacillota bacterium]